LSATLLIVNADDFGFTRDVNAGIVAAHREGILTATTLMANAPAFDDAVRLAKESPSLDIGCHLVLVQGEGLPASIPELLLALAMHRIDIYGEFERQVRKIVNAGIRPTHLDTHKHTHLAPPVLDAVIRIAHRFGIPWVRKPVDFPMHASTGPLTKRIVHQGVRLLGSRFESRLRAAACRTTDHFTGFQITGRLDAAELQALIRELPDGLTELMCHPGFLTDELQNAATRLKESRVIEYQALISPAVRQALDERGARLVCYRDL
jgi:predicted glycoside hydrolase/deacetylase ChbG (UPF0249 family)